MIYIDPPYNTGNDFVYKDDFADPMTWYKEVTQQTTKSNPRNYGTLPYKLAEYDTHLKHVGENRLYWGTNGENTYHRLKKFLCEVDDGMVTVNLWKREEVGTNDVASKDLAILMDRKVFDSTKSVDLIRAMIQTAASNQNNIILDFFSGSSTPVHAVMQLNAEDGGNRQFICVQLPEVCDKKSEAYKAGYKNICEIGKERIRRADAKILAETEEQKKQIQIGEEEKTLPDVGFKVFRLDTSNLKTWDSTPVAEEDMQILFDRMNGMIHRVKSDRSDMDMIYEIMLKLNVFLTHTVWVKLM